MSLDDDAFEDIILISTPDEIEKAEFASRSDAGRYAARQRWGVGSSAAEEAAKWGGDLGGDTDIASDSPLAVLPPILPTEQLEGAGDAKEYTMVPRESSRGYANDDVLAFFGVDRKKYPLFSFTHEEDNALHQYQLTSGVWNQLLRGSRKLGTKLGDIRELFAHSLVLDKLMDKMPRLPQNTQVFRGVSVARLQRLQKMPVGTVFQDNGFMSTSFDSMSAGNFGQGETVIIYCPKGTKGIPMALRGKDDLNPEFEYLLPRSTQYKVISHEKYTTVLEVVAQ